MFPKEDWQRCLAAKGDEGKMYQRKVLTIILALMLLLFSATSAMASFQNESNWVGGKRTLKVKFDPSVTEQWKTWVKEAMANWNKVTADTGWGFVEAGEAEASDVDIELQDIPAAKNSGGARIGPFPQDPITKLTIKIDSDITDEEWPGDIKPSGGQNGWGKTGADTLDPVLMVEHELSHCMRLDHSGDSDTGNLEDPITPGNHNNPVDRAPSDDDKAEGKKADTGVTKKEEAPIGPAGGDHSYSGTNIHMEPGVLESTYLFWTRLLSRTRIPNPTYLGSEYPYSDRGIIYAVELTSDYPEAFSEPVTVTMQYSHSDIGGGYILGMRHSAIFPALAESSLSVYSYNENAEMWEPIPSTLDSGTNTLTFETTHFSVYGIGGSAAVTTGYSTSWLLLTVFALVLVGGYLLYRKRAVFI